MRCLFLFYSILNNEPGEKIPIVVRQTIDYIKNYGWKLSVFF